MAYKFHVAIWQDAQGCFTARTLSGSSIAATDQTPAAVLTQLKRFLTWLERKGLLERPEFEECELRDHRVRVRAEYPGEHVSHPVNPPIEIRVTCAHGRRADGVRFCSIPILGTTFSHQPEDPVEDLLDDALRQALGRNTPQQLSRYLAPENVRLEALFVRQTKSTMQEMPASVESLRAVADLLGGRVRGARTGRAIGRESLALELAQRLSKDRASLLLVGESGVGKSMLLDEAIRHALRAARRPQPEETIDRPRRPPSFWRTSGQRIIAGMKYLGQWEARCERMIEELAETNGVLCVEELLELLRVGGSEPSGSVAAFLAPYLERGELRLIAEATPAQVDACRRLLPGFTELFELVRVPEFTSPEARNVLSEVMREGARHRKIDVETEVSDLVYRLFKRFQPYAAFPGRSVAFARRMIDEAATAPVTRITRRDVLARFGRETGLPEYLLRDDMPLARDRVLVELKSQVLGQNAACEAAAHVVITLKAGMNDVRRPLAVLLFCGPTGVGKTEMAKALAQQIFGAGSMKERLVRLDMSEYSGPGAAHRLLLSPDGEVSDFLRRVRRQPFSVVLLDEIEKASPDVLDVLLGLLDEGRLTDRFGRTTMFQSAVIVMTSNLGAERGSTIGLGEGAEPPFERIAMQTFRPEFFNRIDSVVTFAPLSESTITHLAARELEAIAQRDGFSKAGLRLVWTQPVLLWLAAAGYDARYGARPLQRAVEQRVVAPLARWLLEHPDQRDQTITLDLQNGALAITSSQ